MGQLFDETTECILVKHNKLRMSFQLENFVAMASPLISVRGLVSSFFYYGMKLLFYRGTGKEMLLEDDHNGSGEPLIFIMNNGTSNYFKALRACRRRLTFCSFKPDETKVPYQASAIVPYKCIFEQEVLLTSKLSTVIVDQGSHKYIRRVALDDEHAFTKQDPTKHLNLDTTSYFVNDEMQDKMQTMIENLRSMKWIRIDVDQYHAQAAIINVQRDDIANILVDNLWNM